MIHYYNKLKTAYTITELIPGLPHIPFKHPKPHLINTTMVFSLPGILNTQPIDVRTQGLMFAHSIQPRRRYPLSFTSSLHCHHHFIPRSHYSTLMPSSYPEHKTRDTSRKQQRPYLEHLDPPDPSNNITIPCWMPITQSRAFSIWKEGYTSQKLLLLLPF